MLLTLTFSHSQSESLKSLLERQRKAYKIFLETTKVKEIFKHFGVKYKIRSLEATYGQNGWHPHFHVLLLGYFKIDDLSYRDLLAELWIKSCVRAGLNAPSMTHGLDLRDGTYADQYVSKWGIESELTRFFIATVSVTQLIYMSEVGGLILGTKLPLKIWDLFIIFLIRTIISIPIIAAIAHILF